MHPNDGLDRKRALQESQGLGYCNITKCCTEVCPEHIKITDNGIIPMKERVVDVKYDPVVRFLGRRGRASNPLLSALMASLEPLATQAIALATDRLSAERRSHNWSRPGTRHRWTEPRPTWSGVSTSGRLRSHGRPQPGQQGPGESWVGRPLQLEAPAQALSQARRTSARYDGVHGSAFESDETDAPLRQLGQHLARRLRPTTPGHRHQAGAGLRPPARPLRPPPSRPGGRPGRPRRRPRSRPPRRAARAPPPLRRRPSPRGEGAATWATAR